MYHLFRSVLYQVVLAYAVAKRATSRHMDHVPNVKNHVTPNTF